MAHDYGFKCAKMTFLWKKWCYVQQKSWSKTWQNINLHNLL